MMWQDYAEVIKSKHKRNASLFVVPCTSGDENLLLCWPTTVCCTHSFSMFICPDSLLHHAKLSVAYRLLYWDGILSNQMPVGWLAAAAAAAWLLCRCYMMADSRVILPPHLFDNNTDDEKRSVQTSRRSTTPQSSASSLVVTGIIASTHCTYHPIGNEQD